MIKGIGKSGGRPMLVIGLSRLNCERLMAGKSIMFDAGELQAMGQAIAGEKVRLSTGLLSETQVIIIGGETEGAIMDDMAAHFGDLGLDLAPATPPAGKGKA